MDLIDRSNYFDVLAYLKYQEKILQRSPKTTKRKWAHLRHLLDWAENIPFPKANRIDRTFPSFLLTARNDGKQEQLSPPTMDRACREARDFFQWAKIHKSGKYKSLTPSWIDTLRPSRANSPQSQITEIKHFTFEEVQKLCGITPERLIDKRDRAAIALAYIAGLRVSALVSLPVKVVRPEIFEVHQLPNAGVETKNSKAQITYFLPIQNLIDIVQSWTVFVRKELGEEGLWYPNLSNDGSDFSKLEKPGSVESRRISFSRSLRRFCTLVGIEYKSPHAFRHGHGVFIAKASKTYEEFKAYSQNMGHGSTQTTERYYSRFAGRDVKRIVTQSDNQLVNGGLSENELEEFREFQAYKKWSESKS